VEVVLGIAVLAFLVLVVVGAVTGRVKAQSCCSLATPPPQRDLRLSASTAEPERSHTRTQ
jgi:hypothetical protein